MTDFIFSANPWLLPIAMFIILALSIELPYRFGRTRIERVPGQSDGWNVVQSGLATLAAFVLGLSFAQASMRFDTRRALVITEANAIGTTWLRADQLTVAEAKRFRAILTAYTAIRLQAYGTPGDRPLHLSAIQLSDQRQTQLWSIASRALNAHPASLGLSLLMQTLNETIDVSAEQLEQLTNHVPTAIVVLTLVLVTLATLATGIRFARDGARPIGLSLLWVLASVVVLDMAIDYDRPQTGFVTISLAPLERQLQSMQEP